MQLSFLLALAAAYMALPASGRVVCYFSSWTIYRPGNGKFSAENVDPSLCTHINYAFVGLNPDGSIHVLDDWELTGLDEMNHLLSLKQQSGNLKILLSMGGWNEGSETYSAVAGNAAARQNLVNSVISFLDQYGLDGFDLDWEYPNQRGGVAADVANYIELLGELKSALNGRGLILSAAVSGGVASSELSYDIPAVSRNLDMINLMVYDFHGAFEPFVGHYAPLQASHLDTTDEQRTLNVVGGVEYWLAQGADASKINLGIGTYGRGFRLTDPANDALYAPTSGGCAAGPYTQTEGILGYNEVCEYDSSWQRIWDDEQQVPHIKNGDEWIGYDDAQSVQLKAQYANSKGLGGVMVWALDTDDFSNVCGGGRYPLISAINRGFYMTSD